MQLHAGYSFLPGLLLAGDVGYFAGGRSSVDGRENQDRQAKTRFGLTLPVPFARGWSAKLAASKVLVARVGGDYKATLLTIEYRWFDR